MRTNTSISAQQRIQLLQLRCELERKQLQLHALEIRQACGIVDTLSAASNKIKHSPRLALLVGLVSSAGIGIFLSRRESSVAFLKTGITLWRTWQRYAPLIAQVRQHFKESAGNDNEQ